MQLTHYVHWLAEVHSGGFAPALASLIFNSPCRWAIVNALAGAGPGVVEFTERQNKFRG